MSFLEKGQIFARYRVVHKLGSGTAGDSYEAEDIELQHKVVLKLIYPWGELSDAGHYQFLREIQHASTIAHPRLAEIFDYGEIAGQLYVVRRYVTSGSLMNPEGRRLFLTPLPLADAIKYAYRLAYTLYYLHTRDYMHGSLTLANILVLDESYLEQEPFIVADAGLAHFVRRFGQQHQGILPITAAPEQFDKYVSPATDQYALAVLLYLWLTGRPPFLGSVEETRHMKIKETFPSLATFRAEITPEQENILRKALHVYPDERYPSIVSFAEALLATLASLPQSQQEPEPLQPPDPLPPTGPDVAQPLPGPEPIPQPIPEPEPMPSPEQLPEPVPEVPPRIEPDVAQPLPDPEQIPHPTEELSIGPRLLLRSPQSSGFQEFLLLQDETTLGRAESNIIVLDQDTSTSRRHAIIRRDQQNFVIYDWDSVNGVIVNGQRLAADNGHLLEEGDIISIGAYTLMFQAPASVESASFAVTTPASSASPERQTQPTQLQAH